MALLLLLAEEMGPRLALGAAAGQRLAAQLLQGGALQGGLAAWLLPLLAEQRGERGSACL